MNFLLCKSMLLWLLAKMQNQTVYLDLNLPDFDVADTTFRSELLMDGT